MPLVDVECDVHGVQETLCSPDVLRCPADQRYVEFEKLSYAAGVFDGEGCIILHKSKQHRSFVSRVHVTNTNMEILCWFKERFGGAIYLKARTDHTRHNAFEWTLTGKNAHYFVAEIYPWLVIKRKQAEIFLKFLYHWEGIKRNGNRGCKPRSDEYYAECKIFSDDLKKARDCFVYN